MAVALSDADVAGLGASAREQIKSDATKPARSTAKPEPKDRAVPINPRAGASDRTRQAADITRRAFRASGSGRPTTAHPTVRGVVWLFVWLGVLFYAVSNPDTIPKLVRLVFAPVNGLLQVARGPNVAAAKPTV